jgi:hypothetical protein
MSQTLDNLSYTWNNAGTTFTGIKYNVTDTASNAASLLMDLQVGGTSKFSVNKTGAVTATSYTGPSTMLFGTTANDSVRLSVSGSSMVFVSATQIRVPNFGVTFCADNSINTPEFTILRDAANTLAQRNSTNAQTFNLYNTYTDASNYKRASFIQTATGLVLDSQFLGTGTEPDNILELKSGGTSKFIVKKDGSIFGFPNSSASNYSICFGYSSTASGSTSGVFGGEGNTASNNQAVCIGGRGNLSTANGAISHGFWSLADKVNQYAQGIRVSNAGDAQYSRLIAFNTTADATPTNHYPKQCNLAS